MHIHIVPTKLLSAPALVAEELSIPFSLDPQPHLSTPAVPFGADSDASLDHHRFVDDKTNCRLIKCRTRCSHTLVDSALLERLIHRMIDSFSAYKLTGRYWQDLAVEWDGALYINLLITSERLIGSDESEEILRTIRQLMLSGFCHLEPIEIPRRLIHPVPIKPQRILIPSTGLSDWQRLHPPIHWKENRSAMLIARSWENAKTNSHGFPIPVHEALSGTALSRCGVQLLLALPERQTTLPGRGFNSHTDVFCLARNGIGELIALAVEGKVDESFSETVDEWLASGKTAGSYQNRTKRLSKLCDLLGGVEPDTVGALRYQLFHRTAAALYEAQNFNCQHAVLLVQSFDQDPDSLNQSDFIAFAKHIGATPENDRSSFYCAPHLTKGLNLWLGWVHDPLPV